MPWPKGKCLSPEHKKKLRANSRHIGYWTGKKMSEDHRRKMAETRLGTKRSAETRMKMSESAKRHYELHPEFRRETRNLKPFSGPHSDETRRKIALGHLGVERPEHGEKMTGEGNPAWLGGKSYEPYSETFSPALRRRIRERDNFTCQLCFVPENGRKHAVYHIDYDKKNSRDENLTLLCIKCNTRVNKSREFWTRHFRGHPDGAQV